LVVKDHRPMAAMPLVHGVKEHIRRIGSVRQIADFVELC